jgi:hypothetical protein
MDNLYYIYGWTQENLTEYRSNHPNSTLLQDLAEDSFVTTYYGTIINVYTDENLVLREYKAFLNICKRQDKYKVIGLNDGFHWLKFNKIEY